MAQARQLREKLSRCKSQLRGAREDLQRAEEDLQEERAHSESLGRLLDDAYERLRENGQTDPLAFPVSREAIRLYDEIETPATFDEILDVATGELECRSEETARLMGELVEEGVLARSGGDRHPSYVSTGHEPWI